MDENFVAWDSLEGNLKGIRENIDVLQKMSDTKLPPVAATGVQTSSPVS